MGNSGTSGIIRYLYACSNLTYEEISKLTDIKVNTLANWITGRRNPPLYVTKNVYIKIKKFLSPDEQRIAENMIKTES